MTTDISTRFDRKQFRHAARDWRIFKRSADPASSWYFQMTYAGHRKLTSLRTAETGRAIETAKLLIDAASSKQLFAMRAILAGKRPTPAPEVCTVHQYMEEYERTATGENTQASRHRAVMAFWRLDNQHPITHMNQWPDMLKACRKITNENLDRANDNADKMRIKRSFNSELANAASVISDMAVFALKDKLVLPDLRETKELIRFIRFPDAKKTALEYNPPPAEVLDATIKDWIYLPRDEFLAVGLALSCGLRRGEIGVARWEWFEVHNDYFWCNARAGSFKDGTDTLRAQALNPFFDMMTIRANKELWLDVEGPILRDTRHFDRKVSRWLRDLGWTTRLHLHALRAWAGSLVYMRYGSRAASQFCRHVDEKTTRDHYSWLRPAFQTEDTPVQVAGRSVEWAQ